MALQDELKIVWVKDSYSAGYLVEMAMLLPERTGLPRLQVPWEIVAYAELRADAMPGPEGRYSRRIWFRPMEDNNEAVEGFPLNAVNARFIVAATPSLSLASIDWKARTVTGAAVPL